MDRSVYLNYTAMIATSVLPASVLPSLPKTVPSLTVRKFVEVRD